MSIGPDLDVDPAAAFLEQGSALGYTPEDAEPHDRMAIVIAAGLIASFALTAKALGDEPPPSPGEAIELVNKIWGKVTPAWMRISIEAFRYAIELGSSQGLTHDDVMALAESYAGSLGDYANQTSAKAVSEGYLAQLNAGWNPALAWRRASAGYGLDERGMKAFITPQLIRPTVYDTAEIAPASRSLLVTLLQRRAMGIADNEAYHATQLGKTLVWQYQRNHGLIPEDAMKVWRTARDEKVCAICGPVDGQKVGLDEMFELATGDLVCPGAHPNCRCTVELSYLPRISLEKAYGKDPDTRDAHGRYAATEGRGLKPQRAPGRQAPTRPAPVREREPSPEAAQVADLLAAASRASEKAVETLVQDIAPVAARDIAPTLRDLAFDIAAPVKDIAGARDINLEPTRDVTLDIVTDLFHDTDFGAMVRAKSTTRKITRIFWIPATETEDAREEVVEEEIEPDEPVNPYAEPLQDNTVVMNGAEYFQALISHMTTPQGRDRFDFSTRAPEEHPLLAPREGDIVDIDATAFGRPGPEGSWIPPALEGLVGDEDGLEWIPPLLNWKAYSNSIGSTDAFRTRGWIEERTDEEAAMILDPHSGWYDHEEGAGPLAYLDDAQINRTAVVARRNGATIPTAWKKWTADRRRQWVFEQWQNEPTSNLWSSSDTYRADHAWDLAITDVTGSSLAEESREAIVAADLQDATVNDVEPDLFVFHGHFGLDARTVEGKYRVAKIEFRRLSDQQLEVVHEEIADADYDKDAAFKDVRVFHLEPYDAPWMPQTPADLALGMPDVDSKE